MKKLCSFIKVAPSTQNETEQAFQTPNPDFEDALQYFSAVSVGADVIITRNEKHFMYSSIPVMDALAFLNGAGSNYNLTEDSNSIVNEPLVEYHTK